MPANPSKPLTIVSGLPRSGTSMMMRMMEAGGLPVMVDGERVADDDNPRGYYEFEAVKRTKQDPSWLEGSEGKVVKMVYKLVYDLPKDRKYKVVLMRRRIPEVLASQRKMLERNQQGTQDIEDAQMAELFRSELAAFFRWAEAQEHIDMLIIDYNEVHERPLDKMKEIAAFVGEPLDTQAMADVLDKSLYRNRG